MLPDGTSFSTLARAGANAKNVKIRAELAKITNVFSRKHDCAKCLNKLEHFFNQSPSMPPFPASHLPVVLPFSLAYIRLYPLGHLLFISHYHTNDGLRLRCNGYGHVAGDPLQGPLLGICIGRISLQIVTALPKIRPIDIYAPFFP